MRWLGSTHVHRYSSWLVQENPSGHPQQRCNYTTCPRATYPFPTFWGVGPHPQHVQGLGRGLERESLSMLEGGVIQEKGSCPLTAVHEAADSQAWTRYPDHD